MSTTTVLNSIASQFDRMAKIVEVLQVSLTDADSGYNFWETIDNSNDIQYENSVKCQDITDLDTNIYNANIGINFASWFNKHNLYCVNKLSLTGLSQYLINNGIRIHQWCGDIWEEAVGTAPEARIVFADQDSNDLGIIDIVNGASVEETTAGVLDTNLGDTRLGIEPYSTGAPASGLVTVTLSLRNSIMAEEDSDKEISVTFGPSDAAIKPIAAYAISVPVDHVDGYSILTFSTAANRLKFAVNEYALLKEANAIRYVKVLAIGATNTINVEGSWAYTFHGQTGEGIYASPTFNEVTGITLSASGINSYGFKIKPMHDRDPDWND